MTIMVNFCLELGVVDRNEIRFSSDLLGLVSLERIV